MTNNEEMLLKGVHLIMRSSEDVADEKELEQIIAVVVLLLAQLTDILVKEDEEDNGETKTVH